MKVALTSRALRGLVVAMILLAYPVIGLYPYHWDAPRVTNTARPAPDGGLRFAGPGPGIARLDGPPEWIDAAVTSNRLEIVLRVRPSTVEQGGPARILTLSKDRYRRNLTVGQDREDLIVRIRTPWHNLNGSPQYRVPGVFRAGVWVDVRVVVEPGALRIEVDDELRLDGRLPQTALRNWDRAYRLALGNELTGDRTWLGDIRQALVRTADHQIDYAQAGVLALPARFWAFHEPPRMVPFRSVRPVDIVVNLLGFVPLGLLLGLWVRQRNWLALCGALALVAATSLALEILQLGIPQRYPSINDLFFNVLGGAAGIWLARWRGLLALAPSARSPGGPA